MVDEMKRQNAEQAEPAGLPTATRRARVLSDSDSSDSNTNSKDEKAGDGTAGRASIDTDKYMFSVNDAACVETARHERFHMQRKLHYLRHELLADLQLHTLDFWRSAVLLVLALWVRVYVHYVAQYVFLRGSRVPVYDFQPHWTTCVVKYTQRSLTTPAEIGVVVVGVLGNVALFGFLALAAAVGQQFVGELPPFASVCIVCVGLAAVLDPYLVLLVDVLSRHYDCATSSPSCALSLAARDCACVDGDAFKLYTRFYASEGSGVVGGVLTLVLYVALTTLSLVCVYAYVLHVHMNGRMLDVYRRVHGQEDDFFVPFDSEVALSDLQAICARAKRWKGPRGSQRKVVVHEYVLSDDPHSLDRRERHTAIDTSVHVAVYTLELDGSRELHRHFLKTDDGAIVELFGAIEGGGGGSWLRGAHSAALLALLVNLLQDHRTLGGEGVTADHVTELFSGL